MSQLSFEGQGLHDELLDRGYTLVEHGISTDEIDGLIDAYADFTDNLPDPEISTMADMIGTIPPDFHDLDLDQLDLTKDTQTEWHKYRTNHPQYAKPGGYTNRSFQAQAIQEAHGIDVGEDPKEYYHFHPNSLTRILQQHRELGWGPLPPEVETLHKRFAVIHNLARTAVGDTYRQLEETHPELISKFATKKDLDGSPIRLLFYHNGQGDLLAGGHTDKGLGTVQIAESHMGLRLREPGPVTPAMKAQYEADPLNDPYMHLVRRPADKGVFFIAKAWENDQAFPDSELKATWHDVINLEELNEDRSVKGRNCARWAIIFFTNSEAAGLVQKSQTHAEDVTAEPLQQTA